MSTKNDHNDSKLDQVMGQPVFAPKYNLVRALLLTLVSGGHITMLSGCGVGVIAAAIGLSSGGGSSSTSAKPKIGGVKAIGTGPNRCEVRYAEGVMGEDPGKCLEACRDTLDPPVFMGTISVQFEVRNKATKVCLDVFDKNNDRILEECYPTEYEPADESYSIDWDSSMVAVGAFLANVTVGVRPEGSEPRSQSADTSNQFTVDNRSPIDGFRVLQEPVSVSCGERLGGEIEFRYSLPNGVDYKVELHLLEVEPCRDINAKSIRVDPIACDSGSNGMQCFVLTWDSSQEYLNVSANCFPVLKVTDTDEASKTPTVFSLKSTTSETMHIDNSVPSVTIDNIKSSPKYVAGGKRNERRLVGPILVDYRVVDLGEELVDVEVAMAFKIDGIPFRLSTVDSTLTEYAGVSEGVSGLESSGGGAEHLFVWNSDWDLDRIYQEFESQGRVLSPQSIISNVVVSIATQRACFSKTVEASKDLIANYLVHTVLGASLGEQFANISALAVQASTGAMYIADADTHTVYSADMFGVMPNLKAVVGAGSRRFACDTVPSRQEVKFGYEVLLDKPSDLLELDGTLYILEQGGILWSYRTDTGRIAVAWDGREVLSRPEAFGIVPLDGRLIAYIADTGNCRVIRCDLDDEDPETGTSEVVLGDLRTLNPRDHECIGDRFPERNGCNFLDIAASDPVSPSCTRLDDKERSVELPAGLALWPAVQSGGTSTTKRFLFVSSQGGEQILRIDADPTLSPDVASASREVVLDRRSVDLLCRPTSLNIVSLEEQDYLFICCQSAAVPEGRTTKGVVLRSAIRETIREEDGVPVPVLDPPIVVAGGVSQGTLQCVKDLNVGSTFRDEHECGLATQVPLCFPSDVVADELKRLYVADGRNQRVRRIGDGSEACAPAGEEGGVSDLGRLVTFVGDTLEGATEPDPPEADSLPSPCAFLDELPEGFPLQPGFSFKISEPLGMALSDDRVLFVVDRGNDRVLRYDLRTGLVATVAGRMDTGVDPPPDADIGDGRAATDAILALPRSIAIFPRDDFCGDPNGRMYIVEVQNARVRVIDSEGTIETFAGNGRREDFPRLSLNQRVDPRSVPLCFPRGVVTDSEGRVLISECYRILVVDVPGDGKLRVGVGRNPPADVSSCGCNKSPGVSPGDPVGLGDGGPAGNAVLYQPCEMIFDSAERYLYFSDLGNQRLRRVEYDANTGEFGVVQSVAGNGQRNSLQLPPLKDQRALEFALSPYGLALEPTEEFLYVSEVFGSRIYRVRLAEDSRQNVIELIAGGTETGAVGDGDLPSRAQFLNPNVIQLDSTGKVLFVVDSRNNRVRRFSVGNPAGPCPPK